MALKVSTLCKNCVTIKQDPKIGNSFRDQLVYVKYLDHVLFKDIDPHAMKPQIRETVGWLAEENENHIRIEWERFSDEYGRTEHRVELQNVKQRATGLVILKSCILERRRIL
jgi:hypothetical protein